MGLPQGSIYGPLLFNFVVKDVECQLYANDTVIYTSAKSSAKVVCSFKWTNEKHIYVAPGKSWMLLWMLRKQSLCAFLIESKKKKQ